MLDALASGQRDPAVLAGMGRRAWRRKIPQLVDVLQGCFTDHDAFLVRMHVTLIDQHSAAIDELTDRIETVIKPFRVFRELICTIPGIGPMTARCGHHRNRRRHVSLRQRRASGFLGPAPRPG